MVVSESHDRKEIVRRQMLGGLSGATHEDVMRNIANNLNRFLGEVLRDRCLAAIDVHPTTHKHWGGRTCRHGQPTEPLRKDEDGAYHQAGDEDSPEY